ncbi:MAG: Stp1/IreP family PP2C-type Ser/Thr phosphatase [Vulcanibacillus sp.]
MQFVARTDVGKTRDVNEDYVFLNYTYPNGITIAIVADGMGGHLAGEIASKTAVDRVCQVLEPKMILNQSTDEYETLLEEAIYEANNSVYNLSLTNKEYSGMGTTIIVALISTDWLILAHVGDSRAYLSNGNNYIQLTKDHSLVNELIVNGQITEEEALVHPQRNILTRALGTDLLVKSDILKVNWQKDQKLILTSDGLTNYVSESKISKILNDNSIPLEKMADYLLLEAIEAGGEDNISLIIAKNI